MPVPAVVAVVFAQEHILRGIQNGDPAAWVALGAVGVIVGGAVWWGKSRGRRR